MGQLETSPNDNSPRQGTWIIRILDAIEWLGNKLPDPAILFLIGMILIWVLSAYLSTMTFAETIPGSNESIQIENQLSFPKFAQFLAGMVEEFTSFHPLGVVLVAMLGVGIADYSGFLNACMKSLLNVAPGFLLTPLLIFVAIISHTAADAGYVLVIPIGGVMFYAAGRHPLAGIAAAFAGVSGGFSANFIPSGIDPLLAGLTQAGVSIVDQSRTVNPLCNIFFTGVSSILIILVGWFLTDRIVEPRLKKVEIDGDPDEMPKMVELSSRDQVAMWMGLASILLGVVALTLWALPADSSLRADDANRTLTSLRPPAPLMASIVPLIFLFFAVPGIVYGYVSGNFKDHRDVVKGMSKAMELMGYYLVLVFFAALFIAAFRDSNIGNLVAIKGANFIRESGAPPWLTIIGIILLSAVVNLLVGSASAKWAMLAPIFVPMLMYVGISPELTQAAYRVGDSTTNIITPMMPYFPLVVVFCQRYVKQTGIGTVAAMMLPFSITFMFLWTLFLLAYWGLGFPLGFQAPYEYVVPTPNG